MNFRPAQKNDAEAVLALYKAVIGTPFCVWDDEYPGSAEIERDLAAECLFVLEENGEIIGAISINPENELDAQENVGEYSGAVSINLKNERDCRRAKENAGEFARVVIRPDAQGKGLGKILVAGILGKMRERGYEIARLAVEANHIPAQRLYRSLGFQTVDRREMWGRQYLLCELKL